MRRFILTAALTALAPAAASAAECSCRARGQDHSIGTTLCLASPAGPKLATCDMMLNNTMWRFSDAPCVSAQPRPDDAAQSVAAAPQGGSAYGQTRRQP